MATPTHNGITITIKGPPNSGKTTAASFIKMFLEENGYTAVKIHDLPPLPSDQKLAFMDRFTKNRERPVLIKVELLEPQVIDLGYGAVKQNEQE